MSKIEEYVEWLKQFKAGMKVVKRKGKKRSTLRTYAVGIKHFCEWIQKTPDEVVDEYQRDVKANMYAAFEKWEEIFADFEDWLLNKFSGGTPKTYFAAAKELINVNVPRSLKLQAKTPSTSSRTIRPISKEDLIDVDKSCDERERTFIRFLKDSGISRADAILLNYSDIKRGLERGDEYIKIDVYRGKESVEYETWIGPDTVEMLKVWFNIRQRKGEQITDQTPIFATYYGKRLTDVGLSMILYRIGERIGKKVSTHRLRKFFETYAAVEVRHPIVLKYWMGHKVTSRDIEASYIIPPEPEQRKMYMRAYRNLSFAEVASEEERRIQATFDNLRLTGFSEDEIERFRQERGKTWNTARELITIIREKRSLRIKKVKKRTEANGGERWICHRLPTDYNRAGIGALPSEGMAGSSRLAVRKGCYLLKLGITHS